MQERRKPIIYRDMCLILSVVDLARAGWLAPGHHAGEVELLCCSELFWAPKLPIRTLIHRSGGELHISAPWEGTIRLLLASTGEGPRWWRMVCRSCLRSVRRLYLPEAPPGVETIWGCRHCWGVGYRAARPGESARERLAKVLHFKADVANLERLIRMDMAEERARAVDAS